MGSLLLFGIIIAFLFAGFFAGAQVGFVSLNRLAIELRKKQRSPSAHMLSAYLEHPARFVGAMIFGLTTSLVVYGLLVDQLVNPLWETTESLLPADVAAFVLYIRIAFVLIIASAAMLLFFFFCRAVFRSKSDTLMFFLSPLLGFFYELFFPITRQFILLSEWVLKNLINVRIRKEKNKLSLLELESFIQNRGENKAENQEINQELFQAALTLPYIKIRHCLVPRKEIESINVNTSIAALKEKFVSTNLSKLVVYENNIDNIIGYVHQLSLFKNPLDIRSILLMIPTVPESMTATELMNRLIRDRKSMAWVVDEFGGTSGIVTMEDLLEEIFGEIKDEYDTEELTERVIAEDEYEFSGRLEIDYLNEKYNLNLSLNGSETLSGFIIQYNEHIPKEKEKIIIGDYAFEILQVSTNRIELVKLKKNP